MPKGGLSSAEREEMGRLSDDDLWEAAKKATEEHAKRKVDLESAREVLQVKEREEMDARTAKARATKRLNARLAGDA